MTKPVRVVFDESHSQAWTIRDEVARAMQPSHPADSSYARAADAPAARVLADLPQTGLTARVDGACFYRATTLAGDGEVLARASASSSAPGAPLAIAKAHGAGRVAVLADSDLFGDDCLDDFGHRDLWLNVVHHAALPAFAQPAPRDTRTPPGWSALKEHTDALRLMQQPDGSVADSDPRLHVDAMIEAIGELAPHFAHQRDYLDAVRQDLRDWDFGKPDFTRSLELFRPG